MTEQSPIAIDKVGAAILDGGNLLVVRKRTPDDRTEYIIPGGRREGDESDEETIRRELREELNVEIVQLEYFGTFQDTAVFENLPITIRTYLVSISGSPEPNSEIKEYLWIDRDYALHGHKLGSVLSLHVVPMLIKRNLM